MLVDDSRRLRNEGELNAENPELYTILSLEPEE